MWETIDLSRQWAANGDMLRTPVWRLLGAPLDINMMLCSSGVATLVVSGAIISADA